jgi:signal transduction protein with GAF and PtsI domain
VSKDPFFQGVRMGYGHGIVGHVALTRRSLNIVNAYSDPRFNQLSDLKTGSVKGENIGTQHEERDNADS